MPPGVRYRIGVKFIPNQGGKSNTFDIVQKQEEQVVGGERFILNIKNVSENNDGVSDRSLSTPSGSSSLDEDAFEIIPNPFNQDFKLVLVPKTTGEYRVQIFDSFGSLLLDKSVFLEQSQSIHEILLSTNEFVKGVFIVKFTTPIREVFSKRIIKH
jgi:hypothetical protein